jgi:hypothetical protein
VVVEMNATSHDLFFMSLACPGNRMNALGCNLTLFFAAARQFPSLPSSAPSSNLLR